MSLDETQKLKVAAWLEEGLKLSEIQTRLASELGIQMTYMEVRLLIDDLKLTPKDTDLSAPADLNSAGSGPAPAPGLEPPDEELLEPDEPSPLGGGGQVSVTLDTLALPGAVVSGKVTFSDGQTAQWQLDQYGRLGLVSGQQGYRPSEADVRAFQMTLEKELRKKGF